MTQPPDDDFSFLGEEQAEPEGAAPRGGARRAERMPRRGCGPIAIVAVLAVVAIVVAGFFGIGKLKDLFSGSPDYSGPGTGSVVFEVHQGDSASVIGANLEKAHVVESAGAFVDAARGNDRSRGIQVGYYKLRRHMKASDALDVLINPKNLIQSVVTVPEGARVADVVATIAAKTKIKKAAVVAALEHPAKLGLPASAGGDVEGYLFPATYTVAPDQSAVGLLKQMVAKAKAEFASLDVDSGAQAVGLTPEQVITVASILEYEASRDEDYPKVARAIYNRLHKGMRLQSDATVAYANKLSGQVWTTATQRSNSSPYNTYQHDGLPPGPIGNPGAKTIRAAMHPADGPWLYWVVVNLKTGETVFSTTYADHEKAVARFTEYCKTSTAC
ncbi:MAG TPA: endolytic transglycosylase MltG [Marmoricola sp.]